MTDFDPAPEPGDHRWHGESDTFSRVYDVVVGTTTLTSAGEIAALANCSANAAKKHLDRLVEMGIARADAESQPARYARNEAYFEWQEASRLASELTVDEIVERVRTLEGERDAYEDRFSASDPAAVSALDADDHDEIHERMAAISDWEGVIRDIRLYELARRMAQNDGHLIPA
jgi:predicted ArsR family transcriptional regulator